MLARSPARSPGPIIRSLHRFPLNRTAVLGFCMIALMVVAILSYPLWWSFQANDIDLIAMNAPPGPKHWFGTDGVGRDIFARVMDGGRISLLVAVTSTVISAIIGFLVGAVSALAGRLADAVTMRLVDLVMTLPPVIFLLVLASIAGTGIWPTVFVISLLSWPLLARMVRSRLLELRERDFVMAARGMGAGLPHLLFRHGLPNSIDILVVFATLQIANAILLEAGLSFLGLGIAPPAASWGNMLNAARSTAVLEQYPWQWLFPGGFLVLAVLAINFIGDGLRDAFDPRAELN
ncbi:ABC transporter permease [Rhizobium lentis]|uniref:ABC transporter permease n=1 Tax=Rhizobium lentis TaxID=1138194 RepID=A0ABS7IG30_9HYPH|nr:ABC transporter permease [Rhizobium lentis]MBX4998220.1 ABC transporter permease [Rhizobium lentis]MBX5016655.1 ABC transporter permease [Rhizobium lentis]MBX5090506.1 ABC transporter permease [Rhizobium lentis]